jgi:hypothetical protein
MSYVVKWWWWAKMLLGFYPPTRAEPITSFTVIEDEEPTLRPCCALMAKQVLALRYYVHLS